MTKDPTRETVLVVDDEAQVRETVAEYFKAQGFEALQAGNGLDALLQVKRRRPGAVVLDLMMPRLGGLDALKRIRAFDPQINVVVITGADDKELQRQAALLGAKAFFFKPVDFADLLAAVNGAKASVEEEATSALSIAPPPSASEPEPAVAATVLVVDDEVEIRELLEEYLTRKGYRVRAAEDGAIAIHAITEEAPDVVLLDINMPRLGGIEALTAIRVINPNIKVIMVSGQGDLDRAKRSLAYGAFDYVTKPLSLPYLTQSVETAIVMRDLHK